MLLDVHAVDDPDKVGYAAGMVRTVNHPMCWSLIHVVFQVESLFALTQLLTIFHWGALSDRIGRKPVLLIVSIGMRISMVDTLTQSRHIRDVSDPPYLPSRLDSVGVLSHCVSLDV